jgi:hypothetical protein
VADAPVVESNLNERGQALQWNPGEKTQEMTARTENRSTAAAAVDPSLNLPQTTGGDSLGDLPSFPVMNEWGEWDWSAVHRETHDANNATTADKPSPAPMTPAAHAGPGMIDVAPGNVAALVSLYACTGGVNWITRTGYDIFSLSNEAALCNYSHIVSCSFLPWFFLIASSLSHFICLAVNPVCVLIRQSAGAATAP